MLKDKLQYTFYINANKKTVWDIITSPKGTEKVFYGAKIQSDFGIGDTVSYIGPGRDGEKTLHIYGQVLAYEEYKQFKMTSNVGQVYKENDSKFESVIDYTITEYPEYVKLQVTHDGWHEDDPSYENTKANWWLMLSSIKSLAETGRPIEVGQHE